MKWARLLEVAKRRAWSTTRKEAAERSRRLPPVFDGWNYMIGMFTKPVERRGLLDSWICAMKMWMDGLPDRYCCLTPLCFYWESLTTNASIG